MTDDILAALQGTPPKDKRTRCYANIWLSGLEPSLREGFERVLDPASKWKTIDIYEQAKKLGYERQYNTLRTHRVRTCSCDD